MVELLVIRIRSDLLELEVEVGQKDQPVGMNLRKKRWLQGRPTTVPRAVQLITKRAEQPRLFHFDLSQMQVQSIAQWIPEKAPSWGFLRGETERKRTCESACGDTKGTLPCKMHKLFV